MDEQTSRNMQSLLKIVCRISHVQQQHMDGEVVQVIVLWAWHMKKRRARMGVVPQGQMMKTDSESVTMELGWGLT